MRREYFKGLIYVIVGSLCVIISEELELSKDYLGIPISMVAFGAGKIFTVMNLKE